MSDSHWNKYNMDYGNISYIYGKLGGKSLNCGFSLAFLFILLKLCP